MLLSKKLEFCSFLSFFDDKVMGNCSRNGRKTQMRTHYSKSQFFAQKFNFRKKCLAVNLIFIIQFWRENSKIANFYQI